MPSEDELIDLVAAALRGDDQWDSLSRDQKNVWRADAERAIKAMRSTARTGPDVAGFTYPPELLPKAAEDDEAEVVVCCPFCGDAISALALAGESVTGWQPIETAPKDGGYIVTNRKQQVAFCDVRGGQRIIHNVAGFVEWDWDQPATHWQPLPAPPTITRKSEARS